MSELNYDYKPLPPFKWFILENFPFIEADFDALTNWQLFCKLGKEMNKIIEDMNLTGEQVEALTNAFNQLETYVNNALSNLNLQTEVDNKLDEMAEDGTLASIINDELLTNISNSLTNVITANFENPTMPPVRNLLKNSPKFVSYSTTNNEINVVQKNSNGYLIYTFDNANGDSSASSVGTNWDLIRLKKIQFSQFAYCFKDTYASTVGTLSTLQQASATASYVEENINKPVIPYGSDVLYKNKASLAIYGLDTANNSTPAQVTYNLNYNVSGKANILFYCSALSSTNVDIILNGKTIGNLDLSKFAKNNVGCFYVYEFNIPILQGTATNKLQEVVIKNNDLSHKMYWCCMNYLRLEDYDGRDIDSFKATSSEKYYVNSNGASDYAIYDSDLQKFCGSYHGGETATQQKFTQPNLSSNSVNYNIDFFDSGVYINNNLPNGNTWFIIPTFEIMQVTNINDKGRMISIFDFNNDGCLDMNFNFKGDINTTKFFTGLTCNSKTMNVIKFPNNAGISDGENMLDTNNGFANFTSSTTFLSMDINYSKFPNTYMQTGYENGYVQSTEGYNKFYSYAVFNPSTPVNVKELTFRKVLNCQYR